MSKKTIQSIRLVYGIVLSLMLIVTGILLMIACVNVYKIGNRPFTVINISAAFAKIAIPVWITLALSVIGLIGMPFLPTEKKAPVAIRDKKVTLARLQKKVDMNSCDENTRTLIKKEQKTHTVLRFAAISAICVAAIPAIIYAFNLNHFTANHNASVISACLWILPCTFVAMGVGIAFLYLENASVERQIKYAKNAIVQTKNALPTEGTKERRSYAKLTTGIQIALIVIAIALIIAGVLNGGMADVLSKATNICTECIGLG